MITKNNLLTEYPRIYQSILPKALQQEEFDYIAENIDLYDEGDEDICKYVDTFIEKLNEVLKKQSKVKTDEPKSTFTRRDVTAEVLKIDDEKKAGLKPVNTSEKKPKSQKSSKSSKSPKPPKPKREPKPRKSKIENEVTELPLPVTFIKSYCGWSGKVKTKTQVYTFIKRLQKAIAEKKIRKTSEYAPQIEYMQSRLIAFYNDMRSGTKTYEIPAAKLSELKEKCNMRWADHVVVIRQYINILNDTKTGLKEKSQRLLKKIEASEFTSEAKAAIANITKSLKDYLNGKTDAPKINEFALQGLYGLAVISGLGSLPVASNISTANDNKILSAADFKNASFNLMGFSGKWLQLIGNPSAPFKAMIWGTGGSGKSTLAIEFARYLAGTLGKRVLYVSNEEGAGATFHEKMTRLNAFHPNLFITKILPPRLVEYDFVFCDSANSMQMDIPSFEQKTKLYPYLSWVLLFQTTKDGNFLGEKNWQHAVDVEVYCENGKARALKSRFGGNDEVNVW
jgi:hypothetical protein